MRLLAIDPGPEQSAWVLYDADTASPVEWAKESNTDVLIDALSERRADVLAVEMVASYGMAVGAEIFETCVWIGKFVGAWEHRQPSDAHFVYRREVKLHLCGSPRAKDSNIRQALIDRYGPGKEKAIGLKRSPGPLYGMAGDCWAALAVAITACETRLDGRQAA